MNCLMKFNKLPTINLQQNLIRNYAFKSDLKIKWKRPAKISCIHPERSGDLAPLPKVDTKAFMFKYQNSKELEALDEEVKRIFTIENNPRRERIYVAVREVVGNVQRHDLDMGSIESKIAWMTVKIRSYQEIIESHPRNKKLRVILKETIDKRKKFLGYLRRWDYRRYEWLLEKLNIVYKAYPEGYLRVERRLSLKNLTEIHCDDIRQKRLEEYKKRLESNQVNFLEEKIKNLELIRNEQMACQVKTTITEQDINEAKAKLNSLVRKKQQIKDDDSLLVEVQTK